jgi:hypothetical protein
MYRNAIQNNALVVSIFWTSLSLFSRNAVFIRMRLPSSSDVKGKTNCGGSG